MRVGIVCPYDLDSPGGVQELTRDLAAKLEEAGDTAILIGPGATSHSGMRLDTDVALRAGKPVAIRANDSVVRFTLAPGAWGRVRQALNTVDVIHVHEPLVPLVGWAALASARPLVATFHADPPSWVDRAYPWLPLVSKRLRRGLVTAVSETAARALPRRWGAVSIVPNAVDVPSFDLAADRFPKRVAFLGRDEPRKGLAVLIDAWPLVLADHPDAELVVMGANSVADLPGVRFAGRVSGEEKRRLLASSTIFVAPNLGGESFGIILVEAMAAGCAVVASDLPAFRSVLGKAGRLVPPGDSGLLARSIADALAHPEATAGLVVMAKSAARAFDWSVVLDQYRALYRRAIAL